jgi:hypothetical protein
MLQRINNKSARGEHFTVTVPDIHKVEYAEGGRIATVEIEGGMSEPGQVDWLVYVRTFTGWLPPHESEEISAEKRRQILDRMSQALSALGMTHKMVET